MPKISSISTFIPPHSMAQRDTEQLSKELFQGKIQRLERLLKVFDNGEIESRNFCVPPSWYKEDHSLEERNQLYIDLAVHYSAETIKGCLTNPAFLPASVATEDIDALIFVSSTGIATPSIDARVMNVLPFSDKLVRIPIFGLGCAGGAAGISRAFDYCKAYPQAKVLVVCLELCSLTFQKEDYSKSNLVGASLFADGAACVLVCGDEVDLNQHRLLPHLISTRSKWLAHSEEVMGWQVKNTGLHVLFAKSIPTIITQWLGPFIQEFLAAHNLQSKQIQSFVAHPGGKKVLSAYEAALQLTPEQTTISRNVLKKHGNMSSPTVLYVLEQFMQQDNTDQTYGLLVALGPGFSGEAILFQWRM